MAIFTVLRRATAADVPLAACRAAASSSSRTFHSALSVKLLLHKEVTPFVPSRSFSDAVAKKPVTDDDVVQVFQTEIDCALKAIVQVEIPEEFPFEIKHNPKNRTSIQLKRQYEDETITVTGFISAIEPQLKIQRQTMKLHLFVTVFKGNGVCLKFNVIASRDKVTIDTFSMKKPDKPEDQLFLNVHVPINSDLNENLQKAILNYLEIRGITPGTTNFLQEYVFNKDNKDYLEWLQSMKSFVEK